MDLNFSSEYDDFREEVQVFCKDYKGLKFVNSDQNPLATDREDQN